MFIICKNVCVNQNSQGVVSMQLNLEGLVCPMPIIKLKKYLAQHDDVDLDIELIISDKSGLKDIPAFCNQVGLLCELEEETPNIRFKIKRG